MQLLDYKLPSKTSKDTRELKNLVRQGEGKHIEFKLKTNHPEKIIREMVAFANSNGGKLIIGIADDGEIKGLKFADEDDYVLQKAISKHIIPPIAYDIERVVLENEREILIFDVKESIQKPHYIDLDGIVDNRLAYVRVDDKSVQASREVREIMKGERKGLDIRFHFGEKEKILMEYLDKQAFITLSMFAEIANIPRKIASRTLILLVLAHVLQIQPKEGEDLFMLV